MSFDCARASLSRSIGCAQDDKIELSVVTGQWLVDELATNDDGHRDPLATEHGQLTFYVR
jgi:hypothetical protein